jgi:hypothetical protein
MTRPTLVNLTDFELFIRPMSPNFFHRDADLALQFMNLLGHSKFSVVGWSDGAITGLVLAGK